MAGKLEPHIFTIGHSDHAIERFIELLREHGVTALADVRSQPYSRFHPQFNREPLRACLKAAGVHYVPLYEELGARRTEAQCYAADGKARYDLIAKAPLFQAGLRRVRQGAEQHRIALMCAERDPITCHRTILVCRHLKPLGVPIAHILQDGQLETTAEMERRLLDAAGVYGGDLFTGEAEALERAYDVQGERIAYARDEVTADERG